MVSSRSGAACIYYYATFDLTQARLRRGYRAELLVDIQGFLDHTLPDGTGDRGTPKPVPSGSV